VATRTAIKSSKASTTRKWQIHLSMESKKLPVPVRWIRQLIAEVLARAEKDICIEAVCELNVVFTDDKRIRVINREYRNKDKATDVLSFPQFQPKEIRGQRKVRGIAGSYLGDLVISTETTLSQAKEFGVSPKEELVRLVVHGVLHLCGYDHEKVPAREAQAMRRRERQIRAAIHALC
jgi:probable rRNA maturation factor